MVKTDILCVSDTWFCNGILSVRCDRLSTRTYYFPGYVDKDTPSERILDFCRMSGVTEWTSDFDSVRGIDGVIRAIEGGGDIPLTALPLVWNDTPNYPFARLFVCADPHVESSPLKIIGIDDQIYRHFGEPECKLDLTTLLVVMTDEQGAFGAVSRVNLWQHGVAEAAQQLAFHED